MMYLFQKLLTRVQLEILLARLESWRLGLKAGDLASMEFVATGKKSNVFVFVSGKGSIQRETSGKPDQSPRAWLSKW